MFEEIRRLTLLNNDTNELIIHIGYRNKNYFIIKLILNDLILYDINQKKDWILEEITIFNFFKMLEAFVKNTLEFQKVYEIVPVMLYKDNLKTFYFKVNKINKHNYLFLKIVQQYNEDEEKYFKFDKLEADLIVTMFNRYSRATAPLFRL